MPQDAIGDECADGTADSQMMPKDSSRGGCPQSSPSFQIEESPKLMTIVRGAGRKSSTQDICDGTRSSLRKKKRFGCGGLATSTGLIKIDAALSPPALASTSRAQVCWHKALMKVASKALAAAAVGFTTLMKWSSFVAARH